MKPTHSCLALTLLLASGATPLPASDPGSTSGWRAVVCYEARAPVERIRCGRPDGSDPGLQAVSVDQAGDVALVQYELGRPRARVLYRHGCELTGLLIADVDPELPGEEVFVGGLARGSGREGDGGAVLAISLAGGAEREPLVRRIYEGPAYVHSIELVEPQAVGDARALLVSTYAGEVHLLRPCAGAERWSDRLLHREPPLEDPEAPKIKDAAFLADPSGRAPHAVLLALKTGRTLFLDLDAPEGARLVHEELGGLSRVTADPAGGAYVTGYAGRVLHFTPSEAGFQIDVIDQEGADSGLRGLVLGDFPAGQERAPMALFGFHRLCRLLVPRQGVLDPYTIHVDLDRGHALEAADLVAGNGADELLLGGYSQRVTMLVVE